MPRETQVVINVFCRNLAYLNHLTPPPMCIFAQYNMTNIIKILLAFLSIFASLVAANNSCRQCSGYQHITFNNKVTEQQALSFFRSSLGSCATGNDYYLEKVQSSNCYYPPATQYVGGKTDYTVYTAPTCLDWTFTVKIWRYCGNGGKVTLRRTQNCISGVCASINNLELVCYKSVQCRGTCNCAECGC